LKVRSGTRESLQEVEGQNQGSDSVNTLKDTKKVELIGFVANGCAEKGVLNFCLKQTAGNDALSR
jgi:hypothetical protein